MTPAERFQLLQRLFLELSALPPEQQESRLDAMRRENESLAAELANMLAQQETVSGFLATPALGDGVIAPPTAATIDPPSYLPPPPDQLSQIGPYRILEPLGHGGMGAVYKAEQRSPIKRTVALKLIKPGLDTKDVLARFESERQALARMEHPHIARVLDAGTTESGRPYFVMEHVPGQPVTKFADEHKLSINQRLELFMQVCDAITHAHQKAIIHRDIKAGNVLAYYDAAHRPVVKVIDFGIAKALTTDRLTDHTFNTASGVAIGTYESMSPEQAGGVADVDTRTDVYSLGVLLYELLTGVKPFDFAETADDEIRRVIREDDPPPPSTKLTKLGDAGTKLAAKRQLRLDQLSRQLRSELEWIPLKAMRKERERRYGSPAELRADVENFLTGEPLVAGPESQLYKLGKFVRRNRLPVGLAALIALSLVGGLVGTSYGMRLAQRERRVAIENERIAIAERNRADREAATAIEVNKFLTAVFEAPDTRSGSGKDVKAIDVLHRAAAELAGRTDADPAVLAAVERAIGNSLQSLGDLETAERLLRSAYSRLNIAGADRVALRQAQYDLAGLLRAMGNLVESRKLFEALLATESDDSLDVRVRNRSQYAFLLNDLGEPEFAVRALEPLSGIDVSVDASITKDHRFDLMTARAMLLSAKGEPTASASWDATLAFARKSYGANHPRVAETLSNFAVSIAGEDPVRSLSIMQSCLEVQRRTLPPDHPDLALTLGNLGELYQRNGDLQKAGEVVSEALRLQQQIYPDGHRDIAATLNTLGLIELKRRNILDAIKYFEQSIASYKSMGLDRSGEAAIVEGNLADARRQSASQPSSDPR